MYNLCLLLILFVSLFNATISHGMLRSASSQKRELGRVQLEGRRLTRENRAKKFLIAGCVFPPLLPAALLYRYGHTPTLKIPVNRKNCRNSETTL